MGRLVKSVQHLSLPPFWSYYAAYTILNVVTMFPSKQHSKNLHGPMFNSGRYYVIKYHRKHRYVRVLWNATPCIRRTGNKLHVQDAEN
jgi:hypothetical protein